jgi:tetratricopeptide (TPR) repeat protein
MTMVRNCILVCLPVLLISTTVSLAQDEARAAWQVTRFDITVSSLGTERALNARAAVSLRNVGRAAGASVSLRMNSKAEIKAVTVGGTTAGYRSTPEGRGGAQRITVTLPNSVAPDAMASVAVDYRLPVEENSGLAAISPLGSQFLPASLWYPQLNTPFAVRGADTAPFHLTVAGTTVVASGVDKSTGADSIYEQTLAAMPFFATGSWDRVEGSGNSRGISAFLIKGAGSDERKRADSLIGLAANARSFFSELLGPLPDVPIRLVAVTRGGGFDDSGTALLSTAAFRRSKIDAVTALTIAESIARLKIGEAGVHGEGYGVLREGLARFLATLFFEKEFGAEAVEGERGRQRLAYGAVAKRDAPLSRTTPFDDTYFNSVANKGAMVWRLVDYVVGREAFIATLRTSLQSAKDDPNGFNLARLRTLLIERGGAPMKNLLDQQFDQTTDVDLMVGLPRLEGGQWISALRNLGSIDATVNVVAITESGERLAGRTTIPAHDFGQATFKTASKILRVEVDPEKFYPQIDFANDVVPRSTDSSTGLAEATRLLGAQEYSKAEALARQMLSVSPRMQEARIVLGRALLGANRNDEAEKEFRQLLDERLPTPAALAWADIGLGEIALRRGQAGEAARRFNDAVREDAEYPSTLAARAARIRAEAAANTAPAIDESAKVFLGRLDTAIRASSKAEMDAMVLPGELARFLRGLAGTPSEIWETRVLRTEQLDANRLAADVELHTKQLGVEHAGTAVLILARVGGGWKLAGIEYFEVR